MVSPAARRDVVEHFRSDFELSERRACELAGQHRSTQRRRSTKKEIPGLEEGLLRHASDRPRFGYKRITTLLRRDGFLVNHKRVYRIYRALGLAVKRKRRRRASQAPRVALPAVEAVNDCWSMDFLSDAMTDRRSLRIFAAIDDFSRRCVSMEFDVALPADRVLRTLDRAIDLYGKPKAIRTDNGPEFTSRAFDAWAYARGIQHHFIKPGKPVENAFAESFNGRVRDEFLNQHCFASVTHARDLGAEWQDDYNRVRPHTSLGGLSPEQFLAQRSPYQGQPTRTLSPSHQPQRHLVADLKS